MIRKLSIRNYALIDTLDIDFFPGFSVITGETGAGKSIILGALSLILGQRADTKTVKSGKEKAVVEGRVDVFLSSAGFYRRLVPYGAKDLATAMSPRYPNPNHGEGAAIVVSNHSFGRQTIDSLRRSKVAVPSKNAFSGLVYVPDPLRPIRYPSRTSF